MNGEDDSSQTPSPAQPQNPAGLSPRELAESYLSVSRSTDDVTRDANHNVLTRESLQYMVDNNEALKTTKKQLFPETRAMFPDKNPDGTDIPVYIVPKVGEGTLTASMITLKDGSHAIMANEGTHIWTSKYVQDRLMREDKEVTDAITSGNLIPAEDFAEKGMFTNKDGTQRHLTDQEKANFKAILDSMEQEKGGLGAGAAHIMIDTGSDFAAGGAATTQTKGGANYIFLEQGFLEVILPSDTLTQGFKGIGGHEEAHDGDKDVTPRGAAKTHDVAKSRAAEMLADLKGAGPLGSRDPGAIADLFQEGLRLSVAAYNAEHKDAQLPTENPSAEDLRKISDWGAKSDPQHPSDWERITALRDEARLMQDYEKTHSVVTEKDRKKEEKVVIRQVLKDRKASAGAPAQFKAEDAAPPGTDTMKPDQHAALDAIRERLAGHQQQPAAQDSSAQTAAMATPAAATASEVSARSA